MEKLKSKLICFIFFSELHSIRALLAVTEVLWGLYILLSDDMRMSLISNFVTNKQWASVLLVSGFLQSVILYRQEYSSRGAVVFSGWSTVLWWLIVLSSWMYSELPYKFVSGDFAMAIGASWIFIRAGIPVGAPRLDRRG